jgi:uracil-DNA glycosylase
VIVPLGKCALGCFVPGRKISQVHGQTIEHEGRLLFPLYHPAAVRRFSALRGIAFADVGLLPEVVASLRRG